MGVDPPYLFGRVTDHEGIRRYIFGDDRTGTDEAVLAERVTADDSRVSTDGCTSFDDRLQMIYDDVVEVIKRARPDAMSIEKLYFNTNITTGIQVAQARGVIILAARQAGIPVYEYTPLQVKVAVTGYGKAKKPQVMEMTRRLLHLKEVPKPDDTADALAIAITHTQAAGTDLRRLLMQRRNDT